MKSTNTSWGGVADWYDDLLKNPKGNYQRDLILPNLMRFMDIKKGEKILDLACGQGFFSFEFVKMNANVVGVDVGKELIDLARSSSSANNESKTNVRIKPEFYVSSADKLDFISNASIDKIAIVLAIQNIENLDGVVKECARVLKSGARLFIVMNHPAFRVLKRSSWEWDEAQKKQYRRIDGYMSESREKIDMHPGTPSKGGSASGGKDYTVSFHRPLQVYFKAIAKHGLAVSRLEEWVSNRKSEPGPRAEAENATRKEIPLFLALEIVKTR